MNEHDERFDELAREAGRALRRPAPPDGVERVRHARRRQVALRSVAAGATACVLAVAVWAVVRDDSSNGAVSPATTRSTPGDEITTSSAGTTTTVEVSTTGATASTTEFDPFTPGDVGPWTTIDPKTIAANWTNPCCEDTYVVAISPPFPNPGEALADGEYWARFEWPASGATALRVVVGRFIPTDLGPEEVARQVDTSQTVTLDLPLDDSVRVIFTSAGSWSATGADFAALLSVFSAAVDSVITPRLAGGESFQQIGLDLAAHPTGGFFNPGGVVWFSTDAAPPVGLGHFDPLGLTGCITGVSLVVRDGAYTLLVNSQSGG